MVPGLARGGSGTAQELWRWSAGEPVLQAVDVVGHAFNLIPPVWTQPKCLKMLPLWRDS